MAVEAGRLLTLRAACYGDYRHEDAALCLTEARCFANEAVFTVANTALQISVSI